MPQPLAPLTHTLYAKDAPTLARFYAEVLALRMLEKGKTFELLGADGYELAIVQTPADIAASIHIGAPSEPRAEVPLKASYRVPGIERLRPLIARLGGGLKDESSAWTWRGARHLDGWDPEGNVFQLRESAG